MAVITISRQFGAGGLTLGKMLSKQLEMNLFDNEIIQLLSEKAQVSTDWVKSIEEEAGGKLHKLVNNLVSKSLVDRILDEERGYIDEKIYVDLLHTIIREIAREDNAVIIGRGSQYILQDYPDVTHILLVGEKTDRIDFISRHYDLSDRQAAQAVNDEDRRRVNLYRKFGREDYDDPRLYHLVFNTSRMDLNLACKLVARMVKG